MKKIQATYILACRILDDSKPWNLLSESGCIVQDELTFRTGASWVSIEGDDEVIDAHLAKHSAKLLDERTKQINRQPLGDDVWTVP